MASEVSFPRLKPVHPFPARMAPDVLWDHLSHCTKGSTVLDPMSGSGTTLASAKALGLNAIGFDMDPLAVLIAGAWCLKVDEPRILKKAQEVLERAKKRFRLLSAAESYPISADDETKAFVRYWFDPTNRKQLRALSETISRVRCGNTQTILWCAFSRLIITKTSGASLAMDVSHSRPHRVYDKAPIKPFDQFFQSVRRVTVPLNGFPDGGGEANVTVKRGDARKLPLPSESVDFIATSPPYLNAIDYMRGHKLSLVWMGYRVGDLRDIRGKTIGSESGLTKKLEDELVETMTRIGQIDGLPPRIRAMVSRYVLDIDAMIRESYRVLKPGGRCVFVVGDSTVRGIFIENSAAIKHLGIEQGYKLSDLKRREIPESKRYLPPPKKGSPFQKRMREEVIISFEK